MRIYQIQYKRLTKYSIGGHFYIRVNYKKYYLIKDVYTIDRDTRDKAIGSCNSWVSCKRLRVKSRDKIKV